MRPSIVTALAKSFGLGAFNHRQTNSVRQTHFGSGFGEILHQLAVLIDNYVGGHDHLTPECRVATATSSETERRLMTSSSHGSTKNSPRATSTHWLKCSCCGTVVSLRRNRARRSLPINALATGRRLVARAVIKDKDFQIRVVLR